MEVIFEDNRLTAIKDEVVVGQLRRSYDGIYAIITNGRDKEHPFNAVMVAVDEKMYGHEDGDLVWSINWGQHGTDAEGIRDEFPIRVFGTLSIRGDK